MLGSVNQRVGEIGLRRAVGARPEDIRAQFLAETAAAVVTGGLAGILVGYGGFVLARQPMQLNGGISWGAVGVGLAAAALTGLLSRRGTGPAGREARPRSRCGESGPRRRGLAPGAHRSAAPNRARAGERRPAWRWWW
ncbi:MAG: ABC transporter permease [Gemmatimonadales bacterium]